MKVPTENDINRIYEGFNAAYYGNPEKYDFRSILPFSDQDNGVHLDLNTNIAKGYWELYRPHSDMLICIAEGLYHKRYHQKILPLENTISLRFVLSGNFSMTFDNRNKLEIPQASASITYCRKGREFELSIDEGSHLSSVTIHINPDYLYEKFEIAAIRLPPYLSAIIFDKEINRRLCNFPLSSGLISIILDLLKMPYRGARRRLFTEAKSTELICRLFQEIEDDFHKIPIIDHPAIELNKKLYDVQRILVDNYKFPPTINSLARKVGLNRTTLCQSFKKNFGVSIFDFVQKYRMDKARGLLKDRNLSIAQVANLVGYEHPGNFTTAFKKQFGYLPKSIRHKHLN